jgi:hypothetical protein
MLPRYEKIESPKYVYNFGYWHLPQALFGYIVSKLDLFPSSGVSDKSSLVSRR